MILRPHYLDASAAVKLVVAEQDADRVRGHFSAHSGFVMTPHCVTETLGALKRKRRGDLTEEQYFEAAYLFMAFLREKRIDLDECDLGDRDVFIGAEDLAKRHTLDLVDALQIYTVKHGRYRCFVDESASLLMTADRDLARAARTEGVCTWCVCDEKAPPQRPPSGPI